MDYAVNLEKLILDYNATVHYRDDFWIPGEYDSLDWIVVKKNWLYHIAVNSKLWEYEKAHVIMHEIGHIAENEVWIVGSLICERNANNWALDELIPDEKLFDAIDYYWIDYEHYPELFGVSREIFMKKLNKCLFKK